MATHATPQPQLQCEGFATPPMAKWVSDLASAYRTYATNTQRDGTYCMLVDLT